jgi:hypothetical protein
MSSTAEYDAFGPWIHEIREEEEIPRLYRDYPIDLTHAALTIKIPRQIERRDATPSMDLYDALLSVGPEKLTVLTRRGRRYDFRDLPYPEIQGITSIVDLLDGHLVLSADDGAVDIRFNASSSEIVDHFVALLRERYLTPQQQGAGRPPKIHPPDVERELQLLYRRACAEDRCHTIGVQRRHVVTPLDRSLVSRAVARAWPTTLQTSIFALGADELQVLHRGMPFHVGFKPVHATARTLLPLERIAGVETRPSPLHEGVTSLVVRVGRVPHEFAVDEDVADQVEGGIRAAVRG